MGTKRLLMCVGLLVLSLAFSLLAVGCFSSHREQAVIRVHWALSQSVQTQAELFGALAEVATPRTSEATTVGVLQEATPGVIQTSGRRYGYTGSPLSYVDGIKVSAFLETNGSVDPDVWFEFALESDAELTVERLTNNTVYLTDLAVSEGELVVTTGEHIARIPFAILPAAFLTPDKHVEEWLGETVEPGIVFSSGSLVDNNADLYTDGLELFAPFGYARLGRGDTPWYPFDVVINATELEYVTDRPNGSLETYGNAQGTVGGWVFRTQDGGYARVLINHQRGFGPAGWGFIYEYSASGVFDAID